MAYGYRLGPRTWDKVRIRRARQVYECEGITSLADGEDNLGQGFNMSDSFIREPLCGSRQIAIGEPYVYQTGSAGWEGESYVLHCCIPCARHYEVIVADGEEPSSAPSLSHPVFRSTSISK